MNKIDIDFESGTEITVNILKIIETSTRVTFLAFQAINWSNWLPIGGSLHQNEKATNQKSNGIGADHGASDEMSGLRHHEFQARWASPLGAVDPRPLDPRLCWPSLWPDG